MSKKILYLFDVDGTLAESTCKMENKLVKELEKLKANDTNVLAIVGGGNFEKIVSQIGAENVHLFTYIFSENGIMSFGTNGNIIHENNLSNIYNGKQKNNIINLLMNYLSLLDLPTKTGSFIIQRKGMWYITPIGSDCSYEERQMFVSLDTQLFIRDSIIEDLKFKLKEYNLDIKKGGKIGMGVHPIGWDKTYIFNIIDKTDYSKIFYFGDSYGKDGNDYPIMSLPYVEPYKIDSPNDTFRILCLINEN